MLVCTEKEDGTPNMAPVSFFMFASFTPPVIAFAMGTKKNSGDHYLYTCRVKEFYGDESKDALYAWKGYAKLAGAKEE